LLGNTEAQNNKYVFIVEVLGILLFWIAAYIGTIVFHNVLALFLLLGSFACLIALSSQELFHRYRNRIYFVFTACLVLLIVAAKVPGVDDSFISYHYANNFAAGKGIVFNLGERVEGYSNFLWVAILAGCQKLGFNIESSAIGISIVAVYCYYIVLLFFFQSFTPPSFSQKQKSLMLIAGIAFIASAYWATTGMETTLYSLFFLAATYGLLQTLKQKKTNVAILTFILFGMLSLTRIEGVVFGMIAVFFTMLWEKKLWKTTLFFLIPVVIFHIWRVVYYGSLISQVFLSKGRPKFFLPWYNGFTYLFSFLNGSGLIFIIIACLMMLIMKKQRKVAIQHKETAILGIFVGTQMVLSIIAKGDWMGLYRWYIPIYPLAILLFFSFMFSFQISRQRIFNYIATAVIVMSVFSSISSAISKKILGFDNQVLFDEGIASYIQQHKKPESVIIGADAGVIGYRNIGTYYYDLEELTNTTNNLESSKQKLPANSFFYLTSTKPNPQKYTWGENSFKTVINREVEYPGYFNFYYTLYELK